MRARSRFSFEGGLMGNVGNRTEIARAYAPRTLTRVARGSLLAFGLPVLALFVSVACGKNEDAGGKAAVSPGAVRDTALRHEDCEGREEGEDSNNDGKTDIRHFYDKGGREVCRTADLDFDGKYDQSTYYAASGQVRRRELDFDGNGVINAIEHYAEGQLTLRELDLANSGKIDTWDTYEGGKRVRRERDRNGDGRVDQWWTWDGEKITIAVDRNNDGMPDPESALLWGPNGLVALSAATAEAPSPPASGSSSPEAGAPPPAASTAAASIPSANVAATADAGASEAGASDAGPKRTKR